MRKEELNEIESTVEQRLAESAPEVELLTVEFVGAERLRIFIDREGGVDLELCERVTGLLPDLLEEYSIEVSSPGPERPLARPEHFSAAVGERIKVRTSERIDGRASFTGELLGAGPDELAIDVDGVEVAVPVALVSRANLAPSDAVEEQTTSEREVRA